MIRERIRPDQIVTYTGRYVSPLDPRPDMIDIEDIAHALSNLCRFTGHTKSFYSVAQHSVLVSEICDPDDALWGLLHDASEAYLSDLARPLKYYNSLGDIYRFSERQLMDSILTKFKLPYSAPKSVKQADDILLRSEARDLMPESFPDDEDHAHISGETIFLSERIIPLDPSQAKFAFMKRWRELNEGR